jgi:hypothetical protein
MKHKCPEALDFTSGFWNLSIVAEPQNKTVSTGHDGEIHVWDRAPKDLVKSPAAFQRLIAHIRRNVPTVNVFIDDITIYTRT